MKYESQREGLYIMDNLKPPARPNFWHLLACSEVLKAQAQKAQQWHCRLSELGRSLTPYARAPLLGLPMARKLINGYHHRPWMSNLATWPPAWRPAWPKWAAALANHRNRRVRRARVPARNGSAAGNFWRFLWVCSMCVNHAPTIEYSIISNHSIKMHQEGLASHSIPIRLQKDNQILSPESQNDNQQILYTPFLAGTELVTKRTFQAKQLTSQPFPQWALGPESNFRVTALYHLLATDFFFSGKDHLPEDWDNSCNNTYVCRTTYSKQWFTGWWFQPTPLKNDGVKVSCFFFHFPIYGTW